MTYYFNTTLRTAFEDAVARTVLALKEEGFGIISEIDVQKTTPHARCCALAPGKYAACRRELVARASPMLCLGPRLPRPAPQRATKRWPS